MSKSEAAPREVPAPAPRGASRRLARARNLWLTSVGRDGGPHLVPVWFVWVEGEFYVCTAPGSVKARNLEGEPRAAVSLEDGDRPLICHAAARTVDRVWPEAVVEAFQAKYQWSIRRDRDYTRLLALRPSRWMSW